jgi:hypothetical protein
LPQQNPVPYFVAKISKRRYECTSVVQSAKTENSGFQALNRKVSIGPLPLISMIPRLSMANRSLIIPAISNQRRARSKACASDLTKQNNPYRPINATVACGTNTKYCVA